MNIRKLTKEDLQSFKQIRLEALKDSPDAFGAHYKDECDKPDSFFLDRMDNGFVIGAFEGDDLVSIAGFYINRGVNRAHIGGIWTVYTKPAYRGQGFNKAVMREILDNVPASIELIQLGVGTHNKIAQTFYQSLEFEKYGLEEKALKIEGVYYDEIYMVKFLK